MRIVVESRSGELLDELTVSREDALSQLARLASRYPRANLYVDGIAVEVEPAEEPAHSTPHDLQQQAIASIWQATEAHLRLAAELREQSSVLTAQHFANNQKLIDAATAQREDHRKALKEIGMMERTQALLQFDMGMSRQQWAQGPKAPRSSALARVGQDALALVVGAVEEGARQIMDSTKGEPTDGKR